MGGPEKLRTLSRNLFIIKLNKKKGLKRLIERRKLFLVLQLLIIFILLQLEIDSKKIQLKTKIDSEIEVLSEKKEFLSGINNILISKDNIHLLSSGNSSCTNYNLLGVYTDGVIIVKDSGPEVNKRTLFHEIGHSVWKKLGDPKNGEWVEMYKRSEKFVTSYASISPNEDFAENFACYFTNFDNCSGRMDQQKKLFIDDLFKQQNSTYV